MKKDQNNKPATIYDIAKLTGLSGATVSRVLNNRGYISEDTRAKVMNAAKEMNYSPNPAARTLKTRKTNQIMLSVPDIQNEFYFEMITSIQNIAKNNGYSLFLNYTECNVAEEIKILRKVRENFVDGLIMVSMNFSKSHLDEISKLERPIVLSTMSQNKIEPAKGLFDFVGVDTKKGIYLAAKHLISQGHSLISYAGQPLHTQTGDERYAGFSQAMEEAGLSIEPAFVFTGDYSEHFGYDAGIKLSKLNKRPTAVCAGCDAIALGLFRAFDQKGILVPDDISIAGMDNTYPTTLTKPKITTISLSQDKIGSIAAELIFERLGGLTVPGRTILFQPELIVRESVKKLS